MGDVDHGAAELAVKLDQLGAHAGAQLGVEVGERLVEEEGCRVADQGAAERHALALAAGELAGLAGEQLADAEQARGLAHPGRGLGAAVAADPHAEA